MPSFLLALGWWGWVSRFASTGGKKNRERRMRTLFVPRSKSITTETPGREKRRDCKLPGHLTRRGRAGEGNEPAPPRKSSSQSNPGRARARVTHPLCPGVWGGKCAGCDDVE